MIFVFFFPLWHLIMSNWAHLLPSICLFYGNWNLRWKGMLFKPQNLFLCMWMNRKDGVTHSHGRVQRIPLSLWYNRKNTGEWLALCSSELRHHMLQLHPILRVPVQTRAAPFLTQANVAGKVVQGSPSIWAPHTQVRDWDGVPGCCL